MKVISIHDAKTNLSKYIEAAMRGEKIIIGAYGKPQIQLTPLTPAQQKTSAAAKPKRQFGTLAGKIWVASDAFSPELDEEIWADFHKNLDKDVD